MRTEKKGIDIIKSFESLHDGDLKVIGLQPKMCPASIWTEGYGHAMRDSKGNFLKGIENKQRAYSIISIHNEVEACTALAKDLQIYERIVASKIKVNITQNQFDALVSFTYNTGGSDTVFRMVNSSEKENVFRAWFTSHYIKGGGVILKGLIRRRQAEIDLYFSA
jgi:lysozyme